MVPKGRPYWYRKYCDPDPVAFIFLRTFLSPGDNRISDSSSSDIRGWFSLPRLYVPYCFYHFDLAQNVLATRRDS